MGMNPISYLNLPRVHGCEIVLDVVALPETVELLAEGD